MRILKQFVINMYIVFILALPYPRNQFAPSLQIVAVTDNFLDTLIYICYFSKKETLHILPTTILLTCNFP